MSTPEIILYDLPSRPPCKAWSCNSLKTRIALNYKELPYKTCWTPYTLLAQTLAATGLPPNPDGPEKWSDYTVPAIRMPDGTMIMDSLVIAPALDELKPEPPLLLREDLMQEAQACVGAIFLPLVPELGMRVPDDILVEEDVEWFKDDRQGRFGSSLEDMKNSMGGEKAWEGAKAGFERVEKLLKEHKQDEGPFILGSVPSYSDFIVLGLVEMIKRIGEDAYERLVSEADGLRELYNAGEKWCESK